ncbi:MAG TPA: TMEM175 family protein [Bacteroidia bacterium]|jgi:uncharacterized membrane protein|nr:TMEM175 family protein [Bacteroidia bacterium]
MAESTNSRLEAFCDGVFAIALTLLIIDIKIPAGANIKTNDDLWLAIKNLSPTIVAFLLSFTTILITWVSHHNTLKLVNKSSPQFIYSNGLLLLTIVFIPFPTSLLGQYILTDHATPAVALYSYVNVLMAISWNLLSRAALRPKHPLTVNEKSTLAMRKINRNSYYSIGINTAFTVLAFWFPLLVALFICVIWITWLIIGMKIKGE